MISWIQQKMMEEPRVTPFPNRCNSLSTSRLALGVHERPGTPDSLTATSSRHKSWIGSPTSADIAFANGYSIGGKSSHKHEDVDIIVMPFIESPPGKVNCSQLQTRWLFCWDIWLEVLVRNLQHHIDENPEDFKHVASNDLTPDKNVLLDFLSSGLKSCEFTSQLAINHSAFEQNASKVLRAIKSTSVTLDAWRKVREESLQIQSFIQLCLCKHYSNMRPLDAAEELKLLSWNDLIVEKVSQMTKQIEESFEKLREYVKYYYDQIFESDSKADLTVLVASISIEKWEREEAIAAGAGHQDFNKAETSFVYTPECNEPLFPKKSVSAWKCFLPMEAIFAQSSEMIRTSTEWFMSWNMFSLSVAKELGRVFYQRVHRELTIPDISAQIHLLQLLREESQSFSKNLKLYPINAMVNILNQFDLFLELLRSIRAEMSEWIRITETIMISLGVVDLTILPKDPTAQTVFDIKSKICAKDRQITLSLDSILSDLDGALKFADVCFCTHPKFLRNLSPIVEKMVDKYITSSRDYFSPVKYEFDFEYSPGYLPKAEMVSKNVSRRTLNFQEEGLLSKSKSCTVTTKTTASEADFFMDYDPFKKVYKTLTVPQSLNNQLQFEFPEKNSGRQKKQTLWSSFKKMFKKSSQ